MIRLLFWLAALALGSALRAETTVPVPTDPASGVTLKVSSPLSAVPRFGFLPLRVTIDNLSPRDGRWRFHFEAGNTMEFPGLSTSAFEFAVPSARTSEFWIYVPLAHPGVAAAPSGALTVIRPPPPAAPGGARGGFSPAVAAASQPAVIARQRLEAAGLGIPGPRTSVSTRVAGGTATVTITQTGDPVLLPAVDPKTLPPDFSGGVVLPAGNGLVTRTFVFIAPLASLPGRGTPVVAYQPPPLMIDVTGDGVANDGFVRVAFPAGAPSPLPPLALAADLEAPLRAKIAAGGAAAALHLTPLAPAQLPADWRVWSSFNGLLIPADTFASLDAGRRSALRGWIALGGRLLLVPSAAGPGGTEYLGAGRIETLPGPLETLEGRELAGLLELDKLTPALPDLDRLRFASGTPLAEMLRFEAASIFWIVIFLIVFAVAIGPVNLFLLAPGKNRHRLFLTTPLISLAGAVIVALAIFLQDGLGGEGRRRALVLLVPGENQAAVIQEQATHTGFLASEGFTLDEDVLLTALPREALLHGIPISATLHREQRELSGHWFRNRFRQAHQLRALVPTRARIEKVDTAAGGAPVVVSTLGTELKELRLRDEQGRFWIAASVPPGQRVTLQRDDPAAAVEATSRRLGGNGTPNLADLMSAASLRAPWQWTAQGGAIDLAPIATLSSIDWTDEDVFYAGVAERPTVAPSRAPASPPAPAAPAKKGGS